MMKLRLKMTGLRSLLAVMLSVTGVSVAGGMIAPGAGPQTDGDSDGARRRYDHFFLEAVMQREKDNDAAAFDLLRHCIEIDSCSAEAYFYLAQYYVQLKDKEAAMLNFKKAADLAPDNSMYMETLAQSYVNTGRYAEAIGTFEKLVETDRNRVDVLGVLVQLYQQQGDYDNAIRTVERMEEIEGKSEQLSRTKSDLYASQGNKEAALAEIKRLADEYPYDLNYRGMYADMLVMNGEEKKALDIYAGIFREEPDNSRAQLSLMAYYKNKRDTARADSMVMAILLNKNTSPAGRAYLIRQEVAESEESGGDSTKILRYFKRMAEATPPDADTEMLHASYMLLKKMPQDSVAPVLEKVLEIAPDNSAARLQLVEYAWDDDSLGRVIDLCAAARQYNPDNMGFYYFQGMAYYRLDDYDNALSTFQNGVSVINEESNPGLVSEFYSVLGELLHQKGRKAEAYAAYDSCLQWKSDNLHCLNNYAYYLSTEGGDLDKAERMSRITIDAEPDNANSLDTYAWILFMQERYAEARIYIDQAMRADSDSSAVITEHAGDIYYKCGDTEQAVALWQAALLKDPDNKTLRRKIKRKKYISE